MKRYRKIILALVALVVVCVAAYVIHYLVKYTFYDEYKKYVNAYDEYEEGTEFVGKTDDLAPAEGFVLAAQNESFGLYVNEETCVVVLHDRKNNQYFSTNPLNLGTKAEEGTNSDMNYYNLQSQLIATYYIEGNAEAVQTFNSYEFCVNVDLRDGEAPRYKLEGLKDGLRIIYTMQSSSNDTGMVPLYLSNERYEELLQKMQETDQKLVTNFRGKYIDSETHEGFKELPEVTRKSLFQISRLEACLEAIGYTYDDYKRDMEEAGAEAVVPNGLTVPLEYRLTADGMEVSVPTTKIEESGDARIYELTVLPFFNAERNDGSDGYFLVPNGSGALINFNNGLMASNSTYSEFVYGQDLLDVDRTQEDITEDVKLPLYGIQKEDSTMLITIDDGETLAQINAMVSGVLNYYNYIYTRYRLRHTENVMVAGSADPMPVLEKDMYAAYLVQSYHILPDTEEYDGYSGMAKYYREMLFDDEADAKITNEPEDIKLYLDILGAVKRESSFIGFKYDEVFAMTTFEQAEEMIAKLQEQSVHNLIVNYQGWMNGGYYHDLIDDIKVIRKLGGKKGLASLKEKLEASGGLLYGDMSVQQVTFAEDDFNYTAESSRYYGKGYSVSFGKLSPTTYSRTASLGYIENLYDLLSPKYLPRYIEPMLEEMQKVEVSGISFRDLGNVLYSDKKRKEFITREMAKDIVLAMIEKADEAQEHLMFNNALSYTLPYADDILNVTFYKNSYVYVNEEVPFYQMVIHGYIDYCGKSYNLTKNLSMAEECLEMIENGANPHFTFTWEDSSELKYTGLNNYFSTTFDVWYEDAVEMYTKVNAVLSPVANATMDRHEITETGAIVTYGNGVEIAIDKTSGTVTVTGNGTTETYVFQ